MIITKTPFRMSFFGGGTDMESFFREYGGAVLSTTFDKYCYVNVRHLPPFFSYATELSYAKTERVNSLEEIEHPAIRNAMKMLDMHHIRLTYEADLPARSGLGTSSSFAVGMLNAFYALKGQYASKEKLAKEAIYLERVLCAEAGGWQDQSAAAFGGCYRIDFSADENGTPCMNYYGFGHGVGMSQCGMVGYAQEQGMGYRDILRHYYTGVSFGTVGSGSANGGLFGWLWSLLGL